MGWECERCGAVHTRKPEACRRCGHGVFRSVSREEGDARPNGAGSPKPLELHADQVMGTPPESKHGKTDSSPDVELDSGVDGTDDRRDGGNRVLARVRAWLPF